jgi:alkyl hydroperoxide reductase subunit AhpC
LPPKVPIAFSFVCKLQQKTIKKNHMNLMHILVSMPYLQSFDSDAHHFQWQSICTLKSRIDLQNIKKKFMEQMHPSLVH